MRGYSGSGWTITAPATDANLVSYLPSGTGAVATTVQSKLREFVSVKDFGAVGNGVTDDTAAIQAALAFAESIGGATVFVPSGVYMTSSTIRIGRFNTLKGESRRGSSLRALTRTFAILDIVGIAQSSGQISRVCDLRIGFGDTGIRNVVSGASPFSRVDNCEIIGCRIGLLYFDAYMNTLCQNLVHQNTCGIVMRGQSYQTNIYDNFIDNNFGGLGIYIRGSSGCIIRDNTIQGNRNITSRIGGCGLFIVGFNQRTVIDSNWFEVNCPTTADGATAENVWQGADVLVGAPNHSMTTRIIENCVPAEFREEATAASSGITGGLTFRSNFHYQTKFGYLINSRMEVAFIDISNTTFVGGKGLFNIPVQLTGSAAGCNVSLQNLAVVNTADRTVDAEMNAGVKNSPVFIEGTMPAFGGVVLDGVDILTAQLTLREFAALPGASLDITGAVPTSGNAATYNGVIRAVNGTSGVRTVAGTGRSRLRVNDAACFPSTGTYYTAFLGSPDGSVVFSTIGGFGARALTDTKGFYRLEPITVNSTEVALSSGDYWGALVMTQEQYEASSALRFTTRIQILDMDTVSQPLRSATAPSTYPAPASWNWTQGDIVYNSAPTAGGTIGWVATATGSGTAANWRTFGTIAA